MSDSDNRLQKINKTITRQREFLHRVPDPDTRDRAEGNLVALVQMRGALAIQSQSLSELARYLNATAQA